MTALRTPAPLPETAALRRPVAVRLAWVGAGAVVLALAVVASVAFGVRDVSLAEILQAFGGDTDGIAQAAVVARLPRTVLAIVVGAALAMSGATMQAVTRNPLADPGILGVSGGASLAVVVGIAFFGLSAPYSVMAVAIAGAAGAAVFVYSVGSLGRGGATPLKLTLAGAATSAAFISLVSAVLLPRVDVLETFRFWQIGGVGGATWDRIGALLPVLAIGALICLATARGMNSLALGDDLAAGLGEHVARTRLISSAGAIVLCGAATAIAGPIGFVGLVIPHLCRLLIGTDHRWLLPFSAVAGAALLVAADVVGRVVARPSEIEVGIITALIGAPVFIWIVRRQKVREL
ncbi:iron ABC transporter permease [Microbacterium sp. zg-YB36]|uniref:FecCD family ABC transporter permease n=1 Tax=Microbacterium sp. zg-YB36 TaxID=2969407 RepID=UPI00214C80B8|nr:iron ABC transporter permease [Microbacterium sp. zg-YB36]MDL5350089.1 iron ABC transporter permease [Microbacterium sp. zg-YB36]